MAEGTIVLFRCEPGTPGCIVTGPQSAAGQDSRLASILVCRKCGQIARYSRPGPLGVLAGAIILALWITTRMRRSFQLHAHWAIWLGIGAAACLAIALYWRATKQPFRCKRCRSDDLVLATSLEGMTAIQSSSHQWEIENSKRRIRSLLIALVLILVGVLLVLYLFHLSSPPADVPEWAK